MSDRYSQLAEKRFRQYLRDERRKDSKGQATFLAIVMEMARLIVQFLQTMGVMKKRTTEKVIVE